MVFPSGRLSPTVNLRRSGKGSHHGKGRVTRTGRAKESMNETAPRSVLIGGVIATTLAVAPGLVPAQSALTADQTKTRKAER